MEIASSSCFAILLAMTVLGLCLSVALLLLSLFLNFVPLCLCPFIKKSIKIFAN